MLRYEFIHVYVHVNTAYSTQCRFDVGPASQSLLQHDTIDLTFKLIDKYYFQEVSNKMLITEINQVVCHRCSQSNHSILEIYIFHK